MNTDELSAQYICEDEERLRMALHVYDAMPAVRWRLIEDIFKAAGGRVDEELGGVGLDNEEPHWVYFRTEKTGNCWVFASVYMPRGQQIKLVAGIYEVSIKEETRERFAEVDLETWSDGEYKEDNHIGVEVNDNHGGGRWDENSFLRRAILDRDGVVKDVTDLLIHIYKGMWPR